MLPKNGLKISNAGMPLMSERSCVFAFFSSPVPGHLLPMASIAKQMLERGERVIYFTIPDAAPFLEKMGIPTQSFGEVSFPYGSWPTAWKGVSSTVGAIAALKTILIHRKIAASSCKELPHLFRKHSITHLVIDQNQFQGRTIAEFCGLPFIHVTCTVPMNHSQDFNFGPVSESWSPLNGRFNFLKRLRNRLAFLSIDISMLPVTLSTLPLLLRKSLPLRLRLRQTFCESLTIVGLTPSLNWSWTPKELTYVGSLIPNQPSAETQVAESKPFIYVSLGTISTGLDWLYTEITEALEELDVEFVVSRGQWLGGSAEPRKHRHGLSVQFANQLETLKRASLFINHAGINSVVESLSLGVPLLLLPITNDQPGMAARAESAGVAVTLDRSHWKKQHLKNVIEKMLQDPSLRSRAIEVQNEIAALGGASRAAQLIVEWARHK